MAGGKIEVQNGAVQCAEYDHDDTQSQMAQLIHAGLCSNCKHQGHCVFPLKASHPIHECELHECGLSGNPQLLLVKKPPRPTVPAEAGGDPLFGLCTTCENLNCCRLTRPAGGVWECEEYS